MSLGKTNTNISVTDGADVAKGLTTDAAVTSDANGTLSGKLRGLIKWAFERMPASLGQKAMAASLPVVVASDQSAIPVSGTISTITNVVHVDDNGGSITVDGPLTDTQLRASAVPVSGTISVTGSTVGITGNVEVVNDVGNPLPVNGTVTANAGTNLNTSLLALESGNLALILTSINRIPIAQGVMNNGWYGSLTQGLISDAPPTDYIDGYIQPLSLTPQGRLRVSSEPSVAATDFWGDPFKQDLLEPEHPVNDFINSDKLDSYA